MDPVEAGQSPVAAQPHSDPESEMNMDSHPSTPEQTGDFRDPTRLTQVTRVALGASIAVALLAAWSEAADLLGGAAAGESAGSWLGAALSIAIWLIAAILVLAWIHRANHNARQLGAAHMRFTPGWAVGWYFVPIACFWKPYQAMSEIWRASRDPSDWRAQPVSPLLPWWWALWVVSWAGTAAVELMAGRNLDEGDAETLELEAAYGLAYQMLEIALILILLAIIGAVHRMQTERHQLPK